MGKSEDHSQQENVGRQVDGITASSQYWKEDYWQHSLDAYRLAVARQNPDHELLYQSIPEGSLILDVGCGAEIKAALLKKGTLVAVDYSHVALKMARQAAPRTLLSNADGYNLPFADGSFEVVVTLRVLEYMKVPAAFLDELIRVVKPGGLLLLNAPGWELPHHLPPSMRNTKGLRRTWFIFGRFLRQIFGQIFRKYCYFEMVNEPAGLVEGHREPDDEAVYIVSPYQVERYLDLKGMNTLFRRRHLPVNPLPGLSVSQLKNMVKRILFRFPPWSTGFASCTIIAKKPRRP